MKKIAKFMLATFIAVPLVASQVAQAQCLPKDLDQKTENTGGQVEIKKDVEKNPKTSVQSVPQTRTVRDVSSTPQDQANITIQGSPTTYSSLESALQAATDGSVLEVHGNIIIDNNVTIDKTITLKASNGGGTISTSKQGITGTQFKSPEAFCLQVNTGKTLTLGDGTNANELLLNEVNVKVTKGKLVFKDGVRISSQFVTKSSDKSAIVEITGQEAEGDFEGGKIENPVKDYGTSNNYVAVKVSDGAKINKISGGSFMSWGSSWEVSGKGTVVKEITGGNFSNSQDSGLSDPCFLLNQKASIEKITNGNFRAYSRGALELQSGAHIGEISGGIFKNLYDTHKKPSDGSGAKPYYAGLTLYGRAGDSPVTIDKISAGTFVGVNGVLAVGNTPQQKIEIKSITGGNFSSIDTKDGNTGLYFTQNSEVDELSGNIVATGRNVGLYNAGTVKKIAGGTYIGKNVDGLQNVNLSEIYSWAKNFKGHIVEITNGVFKGKNHGLANAGIVDTISNGVFSGEKNAIVCDKKTKKGQLSTIKGGVYYSKTGNAIRIVSPLVLEPDLAKTSPNAGIGRYYAPKEKAIFNDEKLVTYPLFTKENNEKLPYVMSSSQEAKNDVTSFPDTSFRYLKSPVPAHNKVKFMDGDTLVMTVTVETGKAIATDGLPDQSMPKDPVKKNYTFKEWNTQKDGNGVKFTGDTLVDNDMTVYAVYTKNPVTPPASKPKPKSNQQVTSNHATPSSPNTGDSSSLGGFLSALGLSVVGFGLLRKRKSMKKDK